MPLPRTKMNEFRETYPMYNDYSDEEIVTNVREKFYPDMSEGDVAKEMGVYSSKYYEEPKTTPVREQAGWEKELSSKMESTFSSDLYKISTPNTQRKVKEHLYNQYMAPHMPKQVVDDYRQKFVDTLELGESKARMYRRQNEEAIFGEIERQYDRDHAPQHKKLAQSFLRGMNNVFDGLEAWERRTGLVPKEYYDNLRKGGWQDFGERHVRREPYNPSNKWDAALQAIVESSPAMIATTAAMMAAGPAALGTVTIASPTLLSMGTAIAGATITAGTPVAVGTVAAIAAESGRKRQDLDRDARFNNFSPEQLDEIATNFGTASGLVEGVSTAIGVGILKGAGVGIMKTLKGAGADKAVVGATSKLMTKAQAFGNTPFGRYAKLALPMMKGSGVEMTEEALQKVIGEITDIYYLNPETDLDKKLSLVGDRLGSAEFKKELAHELQVAGIAGAMLPGAMSTVNAAVQAKVDLFSGQDKDNESDINPESIIPKLSKMLDEEVKKGPDADLDAVKTYVKEIARQRTIQEIEAKGTELEVESIEQELEKETDRVTTMLEARGKEMPSEPVVETPKAEEAPTIEEAPEPTPEAPSKFKDKVSGQVEDTAEVFTTKQVEDARKEADVAEDVPVRTVHVDPDTYLNLTTGSDVRKHAIEQKAPKKFDEEKFTAENAPLLVVDKDGNVVAHDGRHRAATMKKEGMPTMPVVVFGDPKTGVLKAQKFGSKRRATTLTMDDAEVRADEAIATKDAEVIEEETKPEVKDVRPERYQGTSLQTPANSKVTERGIGSIFEREGDLVGTEAAPVVDTDSLEAERLQDGRIQLEAIEKELAKGTWKFQELFDAVIEASPSLKIIAGTDYQFRGAHSYRWGDDNKTVTEQKIYINAGSLTQTHKAGTAADVVLAHELLHALYTNKVGIARSIESAKFRDDIRKIWNSIPKETMDKFREWAGEYYSNVARKKYTDKWNNMSDRQRSKREAFFHIMNEASRGKFDEIMTYGMTDANIFKELYKIKGTRDLTGDSIATRMVRKLFDFLSTIFKPSKNILNDLLEVHREYAETSVPGEFMTEEPAPTQPDEPKVTRLPAFTEEDFKAREAKGEGSEEIMAIAPDKESAEKILISALDNIREKFITPGKALPRQYADNIAMLLAQAQTYEVLTEEDVEAILDELDQVPLSDMSFSGLSAGLTDPIQLRMDQMMPAKVKFDSYYAKEEGYVPYGYQFTIADPNHPANKGTFAIAELTQEAIDAKFKDINSMYNPEGIDYMEWIRTDNNTEVTWEMGETAKDGSRPRIELNHKRESTETVLFDEEGNHHQIPAGTPTTEIAWSIVDETQTPIYDRKPGKIDLIQGISTIKRIKSILNAQDRGELRAPAPKYVKFSSTAGDVKKSLVYSKFAKHILKAKPEWKLITDEDGYHVFEPNYVPTEEDLAVVQAHKDKLHLAIDAGMAAAGLQSSAIGAVKQAVSDLFIATLGRKSVLQDIQIKYIDMMDNIYQHTDGGQYYDLDYNYNKAENRLTVRGTHTMYEEIVELFNEVLPEDPAAHTDRINQIGAQLKEGIMEDPYGPPSMQEPIDMDEMEDRFESGMDELSDYSATEHKFEDPDREKIMRLGEQGVPPTSLWEKTKSNIQTGLESLREFRHLKQGQFGDVQFMLRKLRSGRARAMRSAMDHLTEILSGLDKVRYKNLQRLAYMMDLYEQTVINKEKLAKGEAPDTLVVNPYGMSDAEVETEAAKVFSIVRNDQQTWDAWQARQNTWFRIRSAYTAAMDDVGVDVSQKLNRAYYFRHQVLDILANEKQKYGIKGHAKLAAPTQRSYLRKRGATETYAMNLNYVQAEYEVMAQMIYDTHIASTLGAVMERYGSDVPLEGYEMFTPREDSIFYTANTVPGRIVQAAAEAGLKELKVPTKQINQVLAFGGKYEGYYLPREIAATLNDGINRRPPGSVGRTFKGLQTKWKMWQLLNPTRAIKYNVRNITGDAEAVAIGNPKVFAELPNALKGMFTKSQDWQDYLEEGGEDTTLQAQEMEQIISAPEFKHLMPKGAVEITKIPDKVWNAIGKSFGKYFELMRIPTDAREQSLRFAAYLRYKKELAKNNGRPDQYTASLKEEIEVLETDNQKAFVMSNDLIGAYDRISVLGHGLRDYWVPFWSFQEVNLRRTITMFRNAYRNDRLRAHIGRRAGAKTVTSAIKIGGLVVKFMAMSMIMQAYNEGAHEEREKALPRAMRERSHLILNLPGDKKGSTNIYYFPRIGITGDLLEWGGMETVPSDIRDIILGTKTIKDSVKESVIDAPGRLVDKVVQSLGPQFKLPVELLIGEKAFPSVFNTQPITDKWRYVAEHVGAQALYDAATGRPQKKQWALQEAAKALIYKEDINRFGWLAVQQEISKYMEDNKLKGSGFIVTETGNALYNIGLAVRYGDEKALAKYFTDYIKLNVDKLTEGADYGTLLADQWDKLDPLARLNETHKKLFLAQLNSRSLYQLGLAYAYYAEIKSGKPFMQGRK